MQIPGQPETDWSFKRMEVPLMKDVCLVYFEIEIDTAKDKHIRFFEIHIKYEY